jgi:crossover junction endodeoxyribonuclease RusA
MDSVVNLCLPYPPSANRLWRVVRGHMVKSAEARAYHERVGWIARQAKTEVFLTDIPLVVTIKLYRPRKQGDVDNPVKPILDSMQGCVYVNDEQVSELHVYRYDDKNHPHVDVEVRRAIVI